MNTDLRRSKRYADFLPISVIALPGGDKTKSVGPFSGRIIDISKHGACLLMTQVLQKTYHVYHTTEKNEASILELHINIPPELQNICISCRPVWLKPFQIEVMLVFQQKQLSL